MKTLTLIIFAGIAMAQAPQPSPIFGAGGSVTPGNITLAANSYACNPTSGSAAAVNCPLQQVNILNAGVSSSPGTTTTTNTVFPVGTSGPVASCSTFLAGQGVSIAGAGTASALYVGTVVSCTGTTLTVTPTTATSVTSATVRHDETVALQAILTAAATTPTLMVVPNVGACYNISSQLTLNSGGVASAAAFAISGQLSGTGASGSCFSAKVAMAHMIEFLSWHGGYSEHITWDGGNVVTGSPVWVNSLNNTCGTGCDATYQDYISDNNFINLANTTAGIQYADSTNCSPTPQVSEQYLVNSKFYGDTSTSTNAVAVACGGNVKNFTFQHNVYSGFATALSITHQAASTVNSFGDEYLSSRTVDISLPDGGTLNVQGGESESSLKFLNIGAGGGTVPTTGSITGFVWQGTCDSGDTVITMNGSYTALSMIGNVFENQRTGATIPKIAIPGNGQQLLSLNNNYKNATTAAPPWGFGSTGVLSFGDQGGGVTIAGPTQAGTAYLAGASVTGSATTPFLNITGTWNTSGVVDAGIFANITNSASGAASKVIDLQLSGSPVFTVDKAGIVYLNNVAVFNPSSSTALNVGASTTANLELDATSVALRNGAGNITYAYTDANGFHVANSGNFTTVGTKPTITGCGTIGTQTGGALAGTFVAGSVTTCTPVLTSLPTSAAGYACLVWDLSASTGVTYGNIGANSTTSATFPAITITSGDTMRFQCAIAY